VSLVLEITITPKWMGISFIGAQAKFCTK
jgi:hypothetical protein